MFRKLVSNLAFSPALVGQLGFYAQRLKKEEATRRVGLIFTALALVVQSFAVFSPPESANAAGSPADFTPRAATSVSDYLGFYDQNTNNIKDLFTTLGITRDEIAGTQAQWLNSKQDGLVTWGLTPHYSYAQGERTYTIRTSSGGVRTFYNRSLTLWDSSHGITNGTAYKIYVGWSAKFGWFGLRLECGNLITKTQPAQPVCPSGYTGTYPDCVPPPKMCDIQGKTHLVATDPNCKLEPKCTIPGKTNLPASDPNCKPDPVAACSSLKITRLGDRYDLAATSTATNGATITSYTYVIKRNGVVLDTVTHTSSRLSDTAQTTQTKEGEYTVTLTVKTSLGDKTSSDCVKTFHIAPPEMCPLNPKLLKSSPECQPCPGDPTLWIKDEKCAAAVLYTKTAANATQGNIDATKATAKAGDRIVYTLNMANVGKASSEVSAKEVLNDVSDYAEVIEVGNGTFDKQTKTLTWPTFTLKPGEKQTRMFVIKLYDTIPAMANGISDKTSYDCKMDNTFGNSVRIDVDCPVQKKIVEQTVAELPHTGPRENMIFAGVVFAIVSYFYARSRQVKKEVRLIRRDLNAGTI